MAYINNGVSESLMKKLSSAKNTAQSSIKKKKYDTSNISASLAQKLGLDTTSARGGVSLSGGAAVNLRTQENVDKANRFLAENLDYKFNGKSLVKNYNVTDLNEDFDTKNKITQAYGVAQQKRQKEIETQVKLESDYKHANTYKLCLEEAEKTSDETAKKYLLEKAKGLKTRADYEEEIAKLKAEVDGFEQDRLELTDDIYQSAVNGADQNEIVEKQNKLAKYNEVREQLKTLEAEYDEVKLKFSRKEYEDFVMSDEKAHAIFEQIYNMGESEKQSVANPDEATFEEYEVNEKYSSEQQQNIRSAYAELEKKYGKETIDKYYKWFLRVKNEEITKDDLERLRKSAEANPYLGFVQARGANAGTLGDAFNIAGTWVDKNILGGDGYYDPNATNAMKASTIDSTISNGIDNPIGKFLYDNTASTVDSGITTAVSLIPVVGPALSKAMSFSRGMAHSTNDAYERTGNINNAFTSGIASGSAEMFGEWASIGNLKQLKNLSTDNLREILLNFGVTVGVNTSEEMVTEIVDIASDYLINQEASNINLTYQGYLDKGYSENEAWSRTLADFGTQIADAGLGGAFGGAVFGGVGGGFAYKNYRNNVKSLNVSSREMGQAVIDSGTDAVSEVINNGLNSNNSKVKKLANKINQIRKTNKEINPSDIGNLLKLMETDSVNVEAIVSEGLKEKVDTPAYTLATKLQKQIDTGKTVDINAVRALQRELCVKKVSQVTDDGIEEYKESVKGNVEVNIGSTLHPNGIIAKTKKGKKVIIAQLESADSKTNVAKILTTDGAIIDTSTLTISDHNYKALFNAAENFDTNGAKALIANYEKAVEEVGELSSSEYAEHFQNLYEASKEGVTYEQAQNIPNLRISMNHIGAYASVLAMKSAQNDLNPLTKHWKNSVSVVKEVTANDNTIKLDSEHIYADENVDLANEDIANQLVILNSLAKKANIDIVLNSELSENENGRYEDGRIVINANKPSEYIASVVMHEVGHDIKANNPEAFETLTDFVLDYLKAKNVDIEQRITQIKRQYKRVFNPDTAREMAIEELVCNTLMSIPSEQEAMNVIAEMDIKEKRSLLKALKDFMQRIKNYLKKYGLTETKAFVDDFEAINKLANMVNESIVQERIKNNTTDSYSINEKFITQYDLWDKQNPRIKFEVGTTSKVLQSIGAPNKIITWDSSKIIKIKAKHQEITDSIIKQVPNILENPIIIMESKTKPDRLTMFGEVYAENNTPILAVLELNPVTKNDISLDEIKIASAYAKDNAQRLIDTSNIKYIDKNKNRVNTWEKRTRLQLPVGDSNVNSINSISKVSGNVNTKHSFAGINSSTANHSLYQEALQLEKDGVDTESIRQQTGWFKSYDGKWRYEIDDSKMHWLPKAKEKFKNADKYYTALSRYNELEEKIKNDTITDNELNEYYDLDEQIVKYTKYFKLSELIEHTKLFEAYPQLKNVKVSFIYEESYGGNYDAKNNRIHIMPSNDLLRNKKVMVHELQHAIQNIEGFAKGSSPKYWIKEIAEQKYTNVSKLKAEVLKASDESFKKKLNHYSKLMEYDSLTSDKMINYFNQIAMDITDENLFNKFREYAIAYENYNDYMNKSIEYKQELGDLYYESTAGEIEARDTANRMNYSSEQRKNIRPDIDRMDVVFANDSGIRYSVDDIANIQKLPKKSINKFTSNEIQIAEKWARKFYNELGTKSPFFRAWFGDWRAYDTQKVNIAKIKDNSRGLQKNIDTGWEINVSAKIFNETKAHKSNKAKKALPYLDYINDIVKNAILFDTYSLDKAKSENSLFMHSMYAVVNIENKTEVLKLYVEEMNNPNYVNTNKRAYQLQYIEKAPTASVRVQGNTSSSLTNTVNAVKTVSDLYALVKQYDSKFDPKPVNSILLNEDGTPKVFYHGTNKHFTEFKPNEIALREGSFFFAENIEDAKAYGENVYEFYLTGNLADYDNQPSEFYKLKNKREQVEYLKHQNYDGWYADMDSEGWGEVSVFNSSQIKSATDNIGTFNKYNADIRFSLTEPGEITDADIVDLFEDSEEAFDYDFAADNIKMSHETKEAIKDTIKTLVELNTLTQNKRISDNDLRKLCKQAIQKCDSKQNLNVFVNDMKVILNALEQCQKEEDFSPIFFEMVGLFKNVLDKSLTKVDNFQEERKNIKAILKDYGRIKVDMEQVAEVASAFDGYNNYRKQMFGFANLIKSDNPNSYGCVTLDMVWSELSEMYPYLCDPDINPLEIPMALLELKEKLQPTYEHTYLNMDEQALEMAQVFLADIFDGKYANDKNIAVNKQKELFDDKLAEQQKKQEEEFNEMVRDQDEKLKQRKKELEQKIKDAEKLQGAEEYVKKLKKTLVTETQNEIKIVEVNAKNANKVMAIYDKKIATEAREEIRKMLTKVARWGVNPNKNAYMPAEFANAFRDLLKVFTVKPKGEAVPKIYDSLDKLRTQYIELGKKRPENYKDLFKKNGIENLPDVLSYSKEIRESLDELCKKFEKADVYHISGKELREIASTLKSIINSIETARTMIVEGKAFEITKFAMGCINELQSTSSKVDNVLMEKLHNYELEILSPQRVFRHWGNYNENSNIYKLGEMLNQGQRKAMDYRRDFTMIFNESIAKNNKYFKTISGPSAEIIDTGMIINGKKIEITKGMALSLYLNCRNPDNMYHIMHGGIKFPDVKLYKKGKVKESYSRKKATPVTFTDIKRICSIVENDPILMEFAKLVNTLFEKQAVEINKTSVLLFGYEAATIENYFPIVSDENFLNKDIDALIFDSTLAGNGSLKHRVRSKNPILLTDVFDIVMKQIDWASDFCGLALPISNFMKVYNTAIRDDDSVFSFKEELEQVWGLKAKSYLENLIAKLQNNRSNYNITDRFRGDFAQAVLTMNPRTGLINLSAYPVAASIIGHKPLIKAMKKGFKRAPLELINKYTSIMWYRTQGEKQIHLLSKIRGAFDKNYEPLKNQPELRDVSQKRNLKWVIDHVQWLTHWIQKADNAVVSRLWFACEYYVQDNYADLEKGTDEFNIQVAEIFIKVIEETQQNYTVMQTPAILNNKDTIIREVFLMFKSQSLQEFGLLFEATGNLRAKTKAYNESKTSANKNALKQARKQYTRAISGRVVSSVFYVVLGFVAAFALNKTDRLRDENGEITPMSLGSAFVYDLFASFAGLFIGGDELYNFIYAIVAKENYYPVGLSSMEYLFKIPDNAVDFYNSFTEGDVEKTVNAVKNLIFNGSVATGLPTKNLWDIVSAIYSHGQNIINGTMLSPDYANMSNSQKAVAMYNSLMNGDREKYAKIYNTFISQGKDDSNIQTYLRTILMNRSQQVEEGAQALIDNNFTVYESKVDELVEMGFSNDTVVSAIKGKQKEILKQDEDKTTEEHKTYTTDEIFKDNETSAFDKDMLFKELIEGDDKSYDKIYSELIKSGETKKKIEQSMNSKKQNLAEKYVEAIEEGENTSAAEYYQQLLNAYGSKSAANKAISKEKKKSKDEN